MGNEAKVELSLCKPCRQEEIEAQLQLFLQAQLELRSASRFGRLTSVGFQENITLQIQGRATALN